MPRRSSRAKEILDKYFPKRVSLPELKDGSTVDDLISILDHVKSIVSTLEGSSDALDSDTIVESVKGLEVIVGDLRGLSDEFKNTKLSVNS